MMSFSSGSVYTIEPKLFLDWDYSNISTSSGSLALLDAINTTNYILADIRTILVIASFLAFTGLFYLFFKEFMIGLKK